jgi:hypothetical protein
VVAGVAAVAAPEAGWGLAAPSRRLADGPVTVADGVAVEPVEAVAAALRRVWDEATAVAGQVPDSVALVVPATWGPRRGMLLRQAARRGGLGDVGLVSAPVAVARWLAASGVDLPPGGWLALCDVGVDCAVSVVGRTADEVEVLSMTDAAAGGDRLDEALTDHLLTVAATAVGAQLPAGFSVAQVDRCAAVVAVRAAKEALTATVTTVVALPPPLPSVVIGARELATAVEPVAATVAAKCREAIEAAMVDPAAGVGVFLTGGSALSQVVAEGLQRALADVGEVRVVPRPEVAAVLGGAGVSREVHEGRPPVPPVSELPTVTRAIGLSVPAAAALVLAVQFFATMTVQRESPLTTRVYVLANWGELALACLFGLLACLSGATLLASALPSDARVDGWFSRIGRGVELVGGPRQAAGEANRPVEPHQASGDGDPGGGGALLARQVATGLLAATTLAVTVAGMLAVFGGVVAGASSGSFLRWALMPLLPVATIAVLSALIINWRRVTPVRGWHTWLVFPPVSVACAAAGALLVQYSMVAPRYPGDGPWTAIVGHVGGAFIGVAAAIAVAESARWRVVLAGPFAVLVAAVVAYSTTGFVAMVYVLAASAWWARRLWQLVRPLVRPLTPDAGGPG